ncbi:MAG: hypothetical protein ACMG6S_23385 [Byssovorax sp.]
MQGSVSKQGSSGRALKRAGVVVAATTVLMVVLLACGMTQAVAPYCGDCLDAGAAGGGDAGSEHDGEDYDFQCECYHRKEAR